MLKAKYQSDLNKLKVEEKYMRLIANHIEDQINRLKVEEMALKSQLLIQENTSSIVKEPLPEKSDEDVNINAVPLNLGVNYMHNEEDDDDDEDEENTAEVTQLSNFLDQLAKQQHQQEGIEDEEDS